MGLGGTRGRARWIHRRARRTTALIGTIPQVVAFHFFVVWRVLFFTKSNKFDRLNYQDITLLCQPMNKRGVLPPQSTLLVARTSDGTWTRSSSVVASSLCAIRPTAISGYMISTAKDTAMQIHSKPPVVGDSYVAISTAFRVSTAGSEKDDAAGGSTKGS